VPKDPNHAPRPKTLRGKQKAATRLAILTAARGCFGRLGVAGASIQDITRQAGVAQGTFYVHFASKEQVAETLLGDFNQELAAKLTAAWDPAVANDPRAYLTAVATAFLDHWREHHEFVRIYAEHAGSGLDLHQLRDGINPPMRELSTRVLSVLAAARGHTHAPVELVAQGLLSMWLRIGLQCVLGDANPETTRDLLVEMSLGAVNAVLPPATGVES
jgi:AcrR family transcriptional regulator